MHGSLVEAAVRSANAWAGAPYSRSSASRERYDSEIWERERQEEPKWAPEDAVLFYEEPDFDVYDVGWEEKLLSELAPRTNRDDFDPKKTYPGLDPKKAASALKLLVFVYGDREERDLKSALGEPPVDGYLVGLFALCGTDKLSPVALHWRGRGLEKEELSERVQRAVDAASRLPTYPKVPAAPVPGSLVQLIEKIVGQGGVRGRMDEANLVEGLLSLDRASFLEALDGMIPWINSGELGWVDKNDEVADRLWNILGEFPKMSGGKLILAPWKTGLGTPKASAVRIDQDTSNDVPWKARVVYLTRKSPGTYQIK